MGIFLRNRPQNHGARCPAHADQVSGDFAVFRKVARNPPESRPFAAEPAGRRVRERPKFFRTPCRYCYKIDSGITGCEIPPFRPKLSGDIAEFRRAGRGSPRIAPLHCKTDRPGDHQTNETPTGPAEVWRYFYAIGRRIMGVEIPHLRPMSVEISLNFARSIGISLNRAIRCRTGRAADPRAAEIPQGPNEGISTQPTKEPWGCETPPFRPK